MSPVKRASGVPGLRSAIEHGAPPAASEPPATPPLAVNGAEPAVAALPATPPAPEMDERRQNRWRHELNALALKVVAARRREQEATREWETLLDDARNAGVPGHLVVAAAAAANLETPGLGDIPA